MHVYICISTAWGKVLGQQVTDAVLGMSRDASPDGCVKMMKLAFSSLMAADPVLVKEQLQTLLERLGDRDEPWTQCRAGFGSVSCICSNLGVKS